MDTYSGGYGPRRRSAATWSMASGSGPSDAEPAEAQRAPELADIGRLARRAVRGVVGAARVDERVTLTSLLHDHLGAMAGDLAVIEESWPPYEHVNVQAGVDAWLATGGREHRLEGIVGFQHRDFGLAELMESVEHHHGLGRGNAARVNLACGPLGLVRACVRCGLYLVSDGEHRAALLLRGPEHRSGIGTATVQIVGTDPDFATNAAREIRNLALEHNVFRGQVLSFGGDEVFGYEGGDMLQFHERPAVGEGEVILPAETLAAMQRHVVLVAMHRQQLLDAGQHLKRGLLLYGPPGVGKTHTIRHLVSGLQNVTVVQVTGSAMRLIGPACSIARSLQPAMVVIEDVDLIAEDRGMDPGQHPLLFQLLNEMDGLAEDADVIFVLTTNRADLLEPALASRPGRVDQAIELKLPDADARTRLFHLYRGTMPVDTSRLESVIDQTEGVTASFLKELLRRSALIASARLADGDLTSALSVSADDLDEALAELLDTRSSMTRAVLGSHAAGVAPAPFAFARPGLAPPGA